MERVPVRSSNVKSIGFDGATHTLEVEFHAGGIYQYLAVPPEVHARLMAASSKGGFIHRNIKPRFLVRQVR